MGALDATYLSAALLGGLAGSLASLVPGLHVNTLATVALATALGGAAPPDLAVPFLVGALGAATFVSVVPLVILGVPEGEDAPALLPGQRLARQGLAAQALRASASGSVAGLVGGTALALAGGLLLREPATSAYVTMATPYVALAALIVLVTTDPSGPLPALGLTALAGALGHLALALPASSPLDLPGTMLAPLFLGLFAVPALLDAARAESEHAPARPDASARRVGVTGPVLGTLLGAVAGLFPGFTAGPATAVAALTGKRGDGAMLATTSAVNTAAACVATAVLTASGRTRSGVHAAAALLGSPTGMAGLVLLLGFLAAGALVGIVALSLAAQAGPTRWRWVPRLAAFLPVPWLALVLALTGVHGVLVLAAAFAVARTGRAWGCRRSLLMGVLLVPALLR